MDSKYKHITLFWDVTHGFILKYVI